MAVLRPRNRLVYFRISEDEFANFRSICETEGARSISDLARSALQRMIHENGNHTESEIDRKLVMVSSMIAELNGALKQLNDLLRDQERRPAERAADGLETQL